MPVIVSVNIHEARCYKHTFGVDFLAPCLRYLADRNDSTVTNRNIPLECRAACSIQDHAVANYDIHLVLHRALPCHAIGMSARSAPSPFEAVATTNSPVC